ncbi:MAG TPA: hypothetical protein VNZ49_16880 [Bacteroidia bacterium]|nr:hypothetical protein [Bacteroidia bacterium]
MKKNCTLIIAIVFCLSQKNAEAQSSINIYGTQVNSMHSLTGGDKGTGFGVGFLNKGKSIGDKVNGYRVLMQFEGDFFCSGLGRKTVCQVPFITPVLDLSKVTLSNFLVDANLGFRFSFPNKSIFTSYISAYAGFRSTRSYITIKPNEADYSSEGTKHELLAKANGFNFGVGWGVVTSLNKRLKLDVGITYSEANQDGRIANLKSTCADAHGMNLNFKNAPQGIVTVNAGLQFIINWSKYSVLEECDCPEYYKSWQKAGSKNRRGLGRS